MPVTVAVVAVLAPVVRGHRSGRSPVLRAADEVPGAPMTAPAASRVVAVPRVARRRRRFRIRDASLDSAGRRLPPCTATCTFRDRRPTAEPARQAKAWSGR
ncbi:hypothetical protein DI273_07665 [Streptomyces violascens]|nr:hypothetical protein DI273_07665 [Streptomyces violascens]